MKKYHKNLQRVLQYLKKIDPIWIAPIDEFYSNNKPRIMYCGNISKLKENNYYIEIHCFWNNLYIVFDINLPIKNSKYAKDNKEPRIIWSIDYEKNWSKRANAKVRAETTPNKPNPCLIKQINLFLAEKNIDEYHDWDNLDCTQLIIK